VPSPGASTAQGELLTCEDGRTKEFQEVLNEMSDLDQREILTI